MTLGDWRFKPRSTELQLLHLPLKSCQPMFALQNREVRLAEIDQLPDQAPESPAQIEPDTGKSCDYILFGHCYRNIHSSFGMPDKGRKSHKLSCPLCERFEYYFVRSTLMSCGGMIYTVEPYLYQSMCAYKARSIATINLLIHPTLKMEDYTNW